jgi:hypothetical protein
VPAALLTQRWYPRNVPGKTMPETGNFLPFLFRSLSRCRNPWRGAFVRLARDGALRGRQAGRHEAGNASTAPS